MSLGYKKPEPIILSSAENTLLLRADNLQRSDGCELTLSNVRLWISAKWHINHFQMVLPSTVRSD